MIRLCVLLCITVSNDSSLYPDKSGKISFASLSIQYTTGSPSAVRTRSIITALKPSSLLNFSFSSSVKLVVDDDKKIVPGVFPTLEIISVILESCSIPEENNGFAFTNVPTPCLRMTTFSSSKIRSASLKVALLTPSSFAKSNSDGNFCLSL
ncbi:Uncharacterised protein [Streptococcus pneumoniae]|nr:Uncharacterised protein [Streptococcus pneumoniae]